jgi:serine/threonine protein kinase
MSRDLLLCRDLASTMSAGLGTPAYLAPELIEAEPYSQLVDVLAFGASFRRNFCRSFPTDCIPRAPNYSDRSA